MLHVTNGDVVSNSLAAAGIPGSRVPWRDVLYEGPVPADLELAELSSLRADYIAEQGWGDAEEVREDFRRRDEAIERAADAEVVMLWFEHDLYDQLQLIQVLSELRRILPATRLRLVSIDRHPEIPDFRGLGQLDGAQLGELAKREARVLDDGAYQWAHRAWTAFRRPSPEALEALLAELHHEPRAGRPLPFLESALRRFLAEYPGSDGLARSERQALRALLAGPKTLGQLFEADQALEPAPFHGDTIFYSLLERLASGPEPLLHLEAGRGDFDRSPRADWVAEIDERGRRCLAGSFDAATRPGFGRWMGGVQLENPPPWRFDERAGLLRSGGF